MNHCNDQIYCIEPFKKQIQNLRKNNCYKDIDQLLIRFLRDKDIDHFRTGTLLNKSITHPYIKHDIGGRSGYRMYYLAIIAAKCIYLAYIHPKTGSDGSPNTTNEARTEFYKTIAKAIKDRTLYQVTVMGELLDFSTMI
ncbi:hypothetical protein Dfer_4278 [Dyadobacter fermentans DSM 18053]|uniref:Uncharacterized protein n=1 Tax=Dyadobacter fermentans (strain ATCC 700827 / DSM 18053 / CIP 107007 / KCTC 52180 / NS114) TaxID=471854 RepID=C6W125_DYAFD|nr:hypothetical protein Dfer_4278 [Dyadobacter fermentans DSM 18053]